jgi:hypothetical protein
MVTRAGLCCWILLAGCAGRAHEEPPKALAGRAPSVAVQQPAPAASTAPAEAKEAVFRDCGELACKAFPSAEAALDHVLTETPRVLAIGEAHAQSTGPKAPSATRRFMDQLLPRLAPRAADLVIEIWVANGSCGKVEQKVQKQQEAVTAPQAASNQNEFMELGHRAKALSVQPHALVPSCEQYQKIAGAGEADVEEMLRMIRDVTQRDVIQLLSRRPPDRMIVAYGGALHNDLVPREGFSDFSFGPELARATGDRYVELDLVIPEQIKDTEAWRARPWYPHYSREKAGSEAYLYSWAPRAYALFFPKDPAP